MVDRRLTQSTLYVTIRIGRKPRRPDGWRLPIAGNESIFSAASPTAVVAATTTWAELAATARHVGPIGRIGETHEAVCSWCAANRYRLQRQRWEIYGDPDPATGEFEVDVFWSVI